MSPKADPSQVSLTDQFCSTGGKNSSELKGGNQGLLLLLLLFV